MKPLNIDFNERCNLLLNISDEKLGSDYLKAYADKNGFILKDEFHLTIIGGAAGKFIKEASLADESLMGKVGKLIEKFKWDFIPVDEYSRLEKTYIQKDGFKEKRESLIQKVSIPVLQDFFSELNVLLGTSFDVPFPHVTLYVKTNNPHGKKEGIGIFSQKDFIALKPQQIEFGTMKPQKIITIQLPTRPQVDTLITFFIIATFGKEMFQGFSEAKLEINPLIPAGETFESLLEKGTLCIDVGRGPFDHHDTKEKSSAEKAAAYFNQEKNPALMKLLELTSRSEQGKGTISQDALDKMFGFDGMVMTLNKVHQEQPKNVIDIMLPIIQAYYDEAYKRSVIYPETLENYLKEGKAKVLMLNLGGKKWKTCIIETNDSGFIGFLRAYSGGKNEIVAQILPSNHTNILTRMNNGVDLKKLAYLLRSSELILKKSDNSLSSDRLMAPQRIEEVPEWYYDTVTNSVLNGGVHPASVQPTLLKKEQIEKLLIKWQDLY